MQYTFCDEAGRPLEMREFDNDDEALHHAQGWATAGLLSMNVTILKKAAEPSGEEVLMGENHIIPDWKPTLYAFCDENGRCLEIGEHDNDGLAIHHAGLMAALGHHGMKVKVYEKALEPSGEDVLVGEAIGVGNSHAIIRKLR